MIFVDFYEVFTYNRFSLFWRKIHYMISKYFGDKPFWKITVRLALPIAIQNMLTGSFQLIDTLMVSKLGDVALSSVGMAGQWSWLLNLVSFGICSGMSVFAAQYWGVKDYKSMRRVLGIALCSCAVIAVLFFVPAFFFSASVISVFNKEAAVIESGSAYMKIACISYPAVMLTVVLSGFLRNIEKVKVPMYVSAVTTVLNAVINYALIFGKFGLPEMGVRGAATATCISSWTGPVLLILISLLQKNHLVKSPRDLLSFRFSHVKEFFKRAVPVICNEALWATGIVVLNAVYSNMGYEYYAAVTILKTVVDLSFAFFVGLGNACVIMVGKSVGCGNIRRAVTDSRRFALLVPLTAFIIGLLLVIFRNQLISIFNMGDNISELTVQTARMIILFVGLEMPLRMIAYVQVVGIFRSGGDTFVGMLCDVGSLWVFAVPAALLCSKVFALPFIAVFMTAYLAEDIPKSIFCLSHFRSLKWLKPVTEEGIKGKEEYFEKLRNL